MICTSHFYDLYCDHSFLHQAIVLQAIDFDKKWHTEDFAELISFDVACPFLPHLYD